MCRTLLRCLMLCAGVLSAASTILANPIEFQFAGIGSGALDGRAFDDATFVIQIIAETANIKELDDDLQSVSGTSSIHIDPLGDAHFTTPTRVFCNQNGNAEGMQGP